MTDTVGFSVGAVARRLGVAPSTLRTWNRRYGIGARELSPGRHRRYTAEDITRLEHMQKLILRGAAPADAARAALTAPVAPGPAPAGADGGPAAGAADGAPRGEPGGQATAVLERAAAGGGPAESRPGQAGGQQAGDGPDGRGLDGRDRAGGGLAGATGGEFPAARPGPGHGSGGRRLALPGASAAARGLARAVLALDEKRASETIRATLDQDGSVRTWEDLLVPVLSGLGTRFEHTGTCVEAEHLLSVATIGAFSRRTADLPGQAQHRAVLLTSAEGEQHDLPLYALAAALAEQGIDSRVLGSDLPYFALAAAVRRTGPGVVFVWSQAPATGDPLALPDLSPRRPGARLILGGPGWDRERIPAAARLVISLPEALSEIVAALGY
jgi:MerR family transcriptional regulator, light-induced transcriptional regulator